MLISRLRKLNSEELRMLLQVPQLVCVRVKIGTPSAYLQSQSSEKRVTCFSLKARVDGNRERSQAHQSPVELGWYT